VCASSPRSVWNRPGWLEPKPGRRALGYHTEPSRWSREGDRVDLQAVGRGQEFVLDVREYPEAFDWVRQLVVG